MISYPFDEVLKQANDAIERGGVAYQQFTCAGCDNKLTMDVPDTFYTKGQCDKCGHITDLKEQGCNLMIVFGTVPPKAG